jgi:endonuclease-8
MTASRRTTVGEMLLDQTVLAGTGNVFKSEVLFICGIDPWRAPATLSAQERHTLAACARRLLVANAGDRPNGFSRSSVRRTTGRANPAEALWVYGRAGEPCRRCGTRIVARKQGVGARTTYWCPVCQP